MPRTPQAGDILPAKEAIRLIPQTDLSSPIDVPAIPKESRPNGLDPEERKKLLKKIKKLKKDRNAIILAHNYEIPDIQDIADFVGDSLYLAKKGRDSDAEVLLEASVLFMNEILAVMKKPHQTVLAPSLDALCSLAAHPDPLKIREWKKEHPTGKVISYVNTYLEVKAVSDYCCASANAAKVVQHVAELDPDSPILFLPDVHLGYFVAKTLEEMGQSTDRLWLMMGACHVHDDIRPGHVNEARKKYPNAAIAVHPECGCTSSCMRQVRTGEIPLKLMSFRSTSGMFEYAEKIPQKEIIIATEIGNLHPLSKAVPGKTFIPANPEAICAYMKQNTLRSIYESLRDLKHEIIVEGWLAEQARVPIERMLAIT